MNWINIQTSTLRSPQFIGSDPIARGTWLSVLGYCYEQENGGLIKDCATWKDRQWQQICGVTREEIDGASLLMQWRELDLVVSFYPADTEDEIKRKREAGRKGGQARTQAKIEAAKANGAKHNPSITQAEPKQEPNEIEKKGKEIEKKDGSEAYAPPPDFSLDDSPDEAEQPQKPSKQTDEEWMAQLEIQTAYNLIDVRREYSKMQAWCGVNRKTPTRRRFISWLNRIEKPMNVAKPTHTRESTIDRS